MSGVISSETKIEPCGKNTRPLSNKSRQKSQRQRQPPPSSAAAPRPVFHESRARQTNRLAALRRHTFAPFRFSAPGPVSCEHQRPRPPELLRRLLSCRGYPSKGNDRFLSSSRLWPIRCSGCATASPVFFCLAIRLDGRYWTGHWHARSNAPQADHPETRHPPSAHNDVETDGPSRAPPLIDNPPFHAILDHRGLTPIATANLSTRHTP